MSSVINTSNSKSKKSKGAMTLEATIVLPIFLMLFLFMMYMVNVCNAYLALNNAVDQCTKHLGNVAYITNKLDENAPDSMEDCITENFSDVMVGDITLKEYLTKTLKNIAFYAAAGVERAIVESSTLDKIKVMAQNSKIIDTDNLEITLFKMPNQALDGKNASKYAGEFADDDIVLQATYTMHMNLMVQQYDFEIVSTCVEKAWINGSFNEHI